MKKIVLAIVVVVMALSFVGCGNKATEEDKAQATPTPSPEASEQVTGHVPQSNLSQEETTQLGELLQEYDADGLTEERKQELLDEIAPLLEKIQ